MKHFSFNSYVITEERYHGLSDIFNIGNIKKENEELKEMLTPDMNDAIDPTT